MITLLFQVFLGYLTCLGFTIIFNVKGSIKYFAALGGALGVLAFELVLLSANVIIANFFAALVISYYAEIMARVKKVPVTILLIPGLIPFVPGGGIYFTMLHFINGNIQEFLNSLVHTVSIAGALAFGTIILSSLARMVYRR